MVNIVISEDRYNQNGETRQDHLRMSSIFSQSTELIRNYPMQQQSINNTSYLLQVKSNEQSGVGLKTSN